MQYVVLQSAAMKQAAGFAVPAPPGDRDTARL